MATGERSPPRTPPGERQTQWEGSVAFRTPSSSPNDARRAEAYFSVLKERCRTKPLRQQPALPVTGGPGRHPGDDPDLPTGQGQGEAPDPQAAHAHGPNPAGALRALRSRRLFAPRGYYSKMAGILAPDLHF